MALNDIVFIASDDQSMILQLPVGTLGTPTDIVTPIYDEFMYLLTLVSTGGSPNYAYIS